MSLAVYVGFNLPSELSRIGRRAAPSRGRHRNGFTLSLSEDRAQPPIVVKPLGSAYSTMFSSGRKSMGKDYFAGHFLDAQTLAEVLLQSTCLPSARRRLLNITHTTYLGITHGRVMEKYLECTVRDAEATYEVYCRLVTELDLFPDRCPGYAGVHLRVHQEVCPSADGSLPNLAADP